MPLKHIHSLLLLFAAILTGISCSPTRPVNHGVEMLKQEVQSCMSVFVSLADTTIILLSVKDYAPGNRLIADRTFYIDSITYYGRIMAGEPMAQHFTDCEDYHFNWYGPDGNAETWIVYVRYGQLAGAARCDIHSMNTRVYTFNPGQTYLREYRYKGDKLASIKYIADGSTVSNTKYYYSPFRGLTKYRTWGADGKVSETAFFSHGGHRVKKQHIHTNKPKSTINFSYEGDLENYTTTVRPDRHHDIPFISEQTFENGRMKMNRMATQYGQSGFTFYYNDNGDLIHTHDFVNDRYDHCEYIYDSSGNWRRRLSWRSEQEPGEGMVEMRYYKYY